MSNEPRIADIANLHARDGHLTMLTMDRFERGELELALHEVVMEHLDGCGSCADRFDAMQRIAPRITPRVGEASPRVTSSSRWLAATTAVLMAAALILVVWPKPQQASLLPGPEPALSASPYTTSAAQEYGPPASIDLRLFTGEGAQHSLASGDTVHTDEVLRIEVRTDTHGWVALVVDAIERDDGHPDDGADDTGGIVHESTARMLLEPRELGPDDPTIRVQHDVAVDGFATEERIVAISCPEPFIVDPSDLAHGVEAAELPGLPEGCTSRAIHYVPWGRVASS